MAIPLEFCCAIFRKDRLLTDFPGGLDAFFTFCDSPTYLEDDDLIRVSFMATGDAQALVDRTIKKISPPSYQGSFAALVDHSTVPADLPTWLAIGHLDKSHCAWLAGFPPGPVKTTPDGFAARFFRVPFDSFVDRLHAAGISVTQSSTATDVIFFRRGFRLDAVIGIDDDGTFFGILTQIPLGRSVSITEHNLLLDDIRASLRALGWDGNT